MSTARILVADDDPSLREVVRYTLDRAGFEVIEAQDGRVAVERFAWHSFDLVLLDISMPELDGIEVCKTIRKKSQVPIVFLSSRAEELDKVLGLEMGGDDYITKPFSPRELVSRVRAVLRRTRPPEESKIVEAAGVRLDVEGLRAFAGETEITLTLTEFRILEVLARRPGRVFSRDEISERVYDGLHEVSDRTLDSHIRRIRQKLRDAGLDPIETVHKMGFRLADHR